MTNPLLGALDRARPWRVFDRPVFILAAPRSGSTLLREMLDKHPALTSWPGEAHDAFAAAQLGRHDRALGHRWPVLYASERMRRDLSRELYLGGLKARRAAGDTVPRLDRLGLRKVRLLEKTPANIVRAGALARMFPDARFVFLHRDAPATIGSLIESWETPSRAHTRMLVRGHVVEWMMLAAPGWTELADASYAERSAFQWRIAMEYVLEDLHDVPPAQVLQLSYEELVVDPEAHLHRILAHCELSAHAAVLATAGKVGQRGRTSLSAPRPDKWRDRAAEIEPLLPALAPLRRALGYDA